MEKFAAVFKKVQKINKAIIGAVLLLMIGVVFLQTFCRFVIFKSLTWSEELSRYLFVALIVLGINLAATDHLFVRIELIDGYLKGKAQYVMDVIRKGIAIYVSLILMYSGYGLIEIDLENHRARRAKKSASWFRQLRDERVLTLRVDDEWK